MALAVPATTRQILIRRDGEEVSVAEDRALAFEDVAHSAVINYGIHHADFDIRLSNERRMLGFETLPKVFQVADREWPLLIGTAWSAVDCELHFSKQTLHARAEP